MRPLLCVGALLCGLATAAYTVRAPGDMLVIEGRWHEGPLNTHLGVWHDVEDCLHQTADPRSVRWGTARLLIQDSLLAYGATVFDDDGAPVAIIFDRRYALHPTVISHEIIHAITRRRSHENPALEACQMLLPDGLPLRVFPPDSVAHYQRLAAGG